MEDEREEPEEELPSSDELEASVDADFEKIKQEDEPSSPTSATSPSDDDYEFDLDAAGDSLATDLDIDWGQSQSGGAAGRQSGTQRIVVDFNVSIEVNYSDESLTEAIAEQIAEPIKEHFELVIRQIRDEIQRDSTDMDHQGLHE
jgi:hypothetical protein